MGIVTKRGLQRKDLIQRIKVLEYALATSIERQRNAELILDFYIEMNKDGKIPYTGIECDRCKEKAFSYPDERCMACGSGMTLWGDQ